MSVYAPVMRVSTRINMEGYLLIDQENILFFVARAPLPQKKIPS
jgi:hypothetical protein